MQIAGLHRAHTSRIASAEHIPIALSTPAEFPFHEVLQSKPEQAERLLSLVAANNAVQSRFGRPYHGC